MRKFDFENKEKMGCIKGGYDGGCKLHTLHCDDCEFYQKCKNAKDSFCVYHCSCGKIFDALFGIMKAVSDGVKDE